jgi:hypothetical protein
MCSLGHEDQGNQCIPQSGRCLNLDYQVIIHQYLCLPVSLTTCPQCAFQYGGGLVAHRCYSNAEGLNEMLRVGWLVHQPSHAFDDVSTPVFDKPLVIVIPSHLFKSM